MMSIKIILIILAIVGLWGCEQSRPVAYTGSAGVSPQKEWVPIQVDVNGFVICSER